MEKSVIITTKEDLRELFAELLVDVAAFISRPEWIPEKEAMRLLNISKSTLTCWRMDGKISYTQPSERVILYSRTSINVILENSVKKSFK